MFSSVNCNKKILFIHFLLSVYPLYMNAEFNCFHVLICGCLVKFTH